MAGTAVPDPDAPRALRPPDGPQRRPPPAQALRSAGTGPLQHAPRGGAGLCMSRRPCSCGEGGGARCAARQIVLHALHLLTEALFRLSEVVRAVAGGYVLLRLRLRHITVDLPSHHGGCFVTSCRGTEAQRLPPLVGSHRVGCPCPPIPVRTGTSDETASQHVQLTLHGGRCAGYGGRTAGMLQLRRRRLRSWGLKKGEGGRAL